MPSHLATRHATLHESLDETLLSISIRLVELDPRAARVALDRFMARVARHAAVEEERLLPLWAPLTPGDGPRRADHIIAEHRLMDRLAQELAAALEALPPAPSPRQVVEVLPRSLRLRGAFEHHTEREHILYGLLTDAHDPDGAIAATFEAGLVP